LYQILQNASPEVQDIVSIRNVDDEDAGVGHIRSWVANRLKSRAYPESMSTIDTLCSLIATAAEEDKHMLSEQLSEMYPFITEEVCAKKGVRRYREVANMIADMSDPMYASSLEIDQVKMRLAQENISLLTISANGPLRTAEKKWNYDLGKLLENANTKYVAVLLNRNNVHYQYITFKAPDDDEYRAIVHRANLLRLIRMSEVLDTSEKLVLMSGGGSAKAKAKAKAKS
jgi:hypothetical protein